VKILKLLLIISGSIIVFWFGFQFGMGYIDVNSDFDFQILEGILSVFNVISTLLLIATAYVAFESLRVQQKSFKSQKEEMEQQSAIFSLQNFQGVFYKQLKYYKDELDSMSREVPEALQSYGIKQQYSIFENTIESITLFFFVASNSSVEEICNEYEENKRLKVVIDCAQEYYKFDSIENLVKKLYQNMASIIYPLHKRSKKQMRILSFMFRTSMLLESYSKYMNDATKNLFLDNFLSTPDLEVVVAYFLMNLGHYERLTDSKWEYEIDLHIWNNYIVGTKYEEKLFIDYINSYHEELL